MSRNHKKGGSNKMSRNHKLSLKIEKERIVKFGGFIQIRWVNGNLNNVKAIGTTYMLTY